MILLVLVCLAVVAGPFAEGERSGRLLDVVTASTAQAHSALPGSAAVAEANRQDGPWPGFRQNAAHTGQSRESGPRHPLSAWTFDTGGSTYSSPAIGADGTVYIGSADSVYAVAENGQRRWAVPIDGYAISSPAIGSDGTVYIGSRDRKLYALQARDGQHKWEPFEAGDEIWSSPAIDEDGTIYVASFDGNLYAIDPTTGSPRWAFTIGSEIASSPAIGRDGTIYVGALDERLYAINQDGSLRWSFTTGAGVVSSPAIGVDGTVYVGSLDGNLYAVGPDGDELWETPFATNDRIVSSPALGANGTIYVGSLDGSLYAVQANGTSLWTFQADARILSSPAVGAQGVIYFASDGGRLYALNPDGTDRWMLPLPGRIWSSPAIGYDRRIYIASTDDEPFTGRLHAIHSAAFQVSFPTDPVDGSEQVVQASKPDDFVPSSGRLFYKPGGMGAFSQPVSLRPAGDGFEAEIPAQDVTLRGLEYYVELTDGRATATYPPVDPQDRPAFQSVGIGESVTADNVLPDSRYAMISVPLSLENPSVQSVLEDDYGPYVPARWRLMRWENGRYQEYPDLEARFTPGTAFFVAVGNATAFDVDEGQSVDLSTPYRITLQPGWNQIANPFAFPVALSTIERNRSAVEAVAYWNGSEMCQEPSCIDVWEPWKGYFVLNTSEEALPIFVPPNAVESAGSADKNNAVSPIVSGPYVRLVARVAGSLLQDSQNWVGFRTRTSEAAESNIREAPPFGEHVRLSIIDGAEQYAGLFRPLNEEGAEWDLELRLTVEGIRDVDVAVIEEEALPDDFQTYVVDRDVGEVIPLVGGRFTVTAVGNDDVRRLRLVIGTETFGEAVIGDTPDRPHTLALDQNYPNPFNPVTVIRYQTAQRSHVELSVFDVTGRHVRTLVSDVLEAGHHSADWNGLNDAGEPVASGVYLYRIKSDTSTISKKMLLLR